MHPYAPGYLGFAVALVKQPQRPKPAALQGDKIAFHSGWISHARYYSRNPSVCHYIMQLSIFGPVIIPKPNWPRSTASRRCQSFPVGLPSAIIPRVDRSFSTSRRLLTSDTPVFLISKLQVEIELLDDLAPRGYWGSRLRGGFGDGLRSILCPHNAAARPEEHPSGCTCDFQRVFKPTQKSLGITLAGSPMGGSSNLPPPFVIDPPTLTGYPSKGARLNFSFVAIGPMCDHLEECVNAFREFGRLGLERDGGRVRSHFLITDVRDQLNYGRSVYLDGKLGAVKRQDVRETVRDIKAEPAASELSVSFRTNVQIIDKVAKSRSPLDRLKVFDNFWSFASQVVHRNACLWQVYGDDWHGQARYGEEKNLLGQASRQIVRIEQKLEKKELWGHSNERETDKGLHGFVGTMKFAGDFSPFMQHLAIGEIVHIGSETPSGLGQYSFVLLPSQ
jgi:CRISPR-associated endoribonuclease Cas6